MSILIADDHHMLLHGTKTYLESLGYVVGDTCTNGAMAYSLIKAHKPEIAILDISMPEMSGIEVAQKVFDNKLPCKIILLTMHNERSVYKKAVKAGIYGYLLKNFANEELEECLKHIVNNERYTSPRLEKELIIDSSENINQQLSELNFTERKIVALISEQKSTKQIADLLFMSDKTIEWHRSNIIEKLDLPREKNALLTWALKNHPSVN